MPESRLPDEYFNPRMLSPKYADADRPYIMPSIDERPSCLPLTLSENGDLLEWTLPVLGLGDLVLKATSDMETGRLVFVGVRID